MARSSVSLGYGRVFSTMGCGSMPGMRTVSPFLNDVFPLLASAMAAVYSATVMYFDSVRCWRARKTAVVSALASWAIVPGGNGCAGAGLPDAVCTFAGDVVAPAFCAGVVDVCAGAAAETLVCEINCGWRAKNMIATARPTTMSVAVEKMPNFLGAMRTLFRGLNEY